MGIPKKIDPIKERSFSSGLQLSPIDGMNSIHFPESIKLPPGNPMNRTIPSVSLDVITNNTLSTYLCETIEHYQLFASYLSECFALENLFFLERAIILFH